MTNEQAIIELIAAVKLITQGIEEIRNCMTIIDKRVTALEARYSNASDALNACFMMQKDEVKND